MTSFNNNQWVDYDSLQWVDNDLYQWGFTADTELFQICTDNSYVYAVTTDGLDIIEIESEDKVSYVNNEGGFSTVWASDDDVYLGTSSDGIKYLEKNTISGSVGSPVNLISNLKNYDFQYNPSSPEIIFLHGYEDILSVVTSSGIDILKNGSGSFKSYTNCSGVTKCFMTPKKELYYIVQNSEDDGIHKINTVLCDWVNPDVSYLSGASFLPAGQDVNDVYVTVNTSETGEDNTLFVATSYGVFVWDEGTGGFDAYYT